MIERTLFVLYLLHYISLYKCLVCGLFIALILPITALNECLQGYIRLLLVQWQYYCPGYLYSGTVVIQNSRQFYGLSFTVLWRQNCLFIYQCYLALYFICFLYSTLFVALFLVINLWFLSFNLQIFVLFIYFVTTFIQKLLMLVERNLNFLFLISLIYNY